MFESRHRRSANSVEHALAYVCADLFQCIGHADEKPSRHRVESHSAATARDLFVQFVGERESSGQAQGIRRSATALWQSVQGRRTVVFLQVIIIVNLNQKKKKSIRIMI